MLGSEVSEGLLINLEFLTLLVDGLLGLDDVILTLGHRVLAVSEPLDFLPQQPLTGLQLLPLLTQPALTNNRRVLTVLTNERPALPTCRNQPAAGRGGAAVLSGPPAADNYDDGCWN